jgi:hypothetical protein
MKLVHIHVIHRVKWRLEIFMLLHAVTEEIISLTVISVVLIVIIAILFIFTLMFKTNMFHIM